jgi:hypothetical protein
LEEERRRREIVWLGNLLYAAAHFFADVFNAQRWRLSERAKCFLSYIMCCVWGCSRYGNHSHGDFFFLLLRLSRNDRLARRDRYRWRLIDHRREMSHTGVSCVSLGLDMSTAGAIILL